MSVSVTWNFPKLNKKLLARRAELALFLAAQVQTNRGLLFASEGSRNGGKRWPKPLLRSGMALSQRGVLRKSLAPGTGRPGPGGIARITGDDVVIGTNVRYAPIVNFGGKFTAGPGKVFVIPLPAGKAASGYAKALRSGIQADNKRRKSMGLKARPTNVIFRKSITIPPRRFDIMTAADKKEISDAYRKKIAELLNR